VRGRAVAAKKKISSVPPSDDVGKTVRKRGERSSAGEMTVICWVKPAKRNRTSGRPTGKDALREQESGSFASGISRFTQALQSTDGKKTTAKKGQNSLRQVLRSHTTGGSTITSALSGGTNYQDADW